MINTWAIMQKAQADRLIYINPVAREHHAWVSCSVNKSLNNMLDR